MTVPGNRGADRGMHLAVVSCEKYVVRFVFGEAEYLLISRLADRSDRIFSVSLILFLEDV